MSQNKVMVGLSGGVDSAVAALLLQRAGERVEALFMKNWEEDDASGTCTAEADARDAQAVAEVLGVAFHTRNFAAEYWDGVFAHFVAEYRAGRTPNPDVLCNREIKFRTFLEHAQDLGADRIATGHYARVEHRGGRARLLRGRDPNKDQSYFLHLVGHEALARTVFPLGELEKPQVRALAREAGFPVHAKKDSTGVCFIGERDFRGFLGRYVETAPGPIESPAGERLGEHPGVMFFTLGQREGLRIGGRRGGSGAPWYVVGKDLARRALIVDQGDSTHLYAQRIATAGAHWIAGTPPSTRFDAQAQHRYRQPAQRCAVSVRDDGGLDVRFEAPQRAVTPGQSLVLYRDDECLGGATIEATDARYGGLAA